MSDMLRAARGRTAVLIATLAGLLTLLTGCGNGDVPQYLNEIGPGSDGRVGDVAVTDAVLAYEGPVEGDTVYRPGETVRVQATIVNEGVPDRLVSVSSPIAGSGLIFGDATLPGDHALVSGYTEPIASVVLPDTTAVDLLLADLNTPIRAGLTYPVVFTFARAGQLRLQLRVDNPDEPVPGAGCPLLETEEPPRAFTAPIGRAPAPPPRSPPGECDIKFERLDVESPVSHPTWSPEHDALLGFVEEGGRRLVRLDPETGEIVRSRAVEGAGEDFDLIATEPHERVALPLTDADRIVLLDSGSFEEVAGVDAVAAPSWVAVQESTTSVFALSEDASTVTGVDYERLAVTFRREVQQDPETVVEADDRADRSFWLIAPEAITYFSAVPQPQPEAVPPVELSHKTFSPDDGEAGSAYFAAADSTRVALLEGDPRGGWEISASSSLGEKVEHLEAEPEEKLVYALTATTLFTLKFDTLEVLGTTEFRTTLEQADLGDAMISDFTVGDEYLYLALEDEPHILKIRK